MEKRAPRKKPAAAAEPQDLMLNLGFGNWVPARRVTVIVNPNSAPIKRLRDDARAEHRLVDATCGRKTRSIIVLDSNQVILSAIQSDTVSQRFEALKDRLEPRAEEEE